jgi:hypothetical protein
MKLMVVRGNAKANEHYGEHNLTCEKVSFEAHPKLGYSLIYRIVVKLANLTIAMLQFNKN